MIVRPLQPADRARWDAYVRARPDSHFAQRTAWMDLVTDAYRLPARWWLAEEGGTVRGVLPLFEVPGRRLFSAPGGLLADDADTAAALLEPARARLRDARLEWIELRDQRTEWPGLATNREHVTLELALAADADAQWKAFDAKLRNQVRKGEKSGFTARWGHAHAGDFHRVLLENMRDLGTPIRGPAYYRRALELFGDDADVLVLDLAGAPAGAMFVVWHGDVAMDPWASSLRRHFARCPNHVLYWEAIRRAVARGARRFDFGRSQWGSGTFAFKASWGAVPVPLFYQYALGRAARVPTLADQKRSLDLAVRVWRRLPVAVAGALGERVKRLFPEAL